MKRTHALAVSGALVALVSSSSVLAPRAARAEGEPACEAWEVEYATSGRLSIRDTSMGAGDGDHTVGPGSITLRWSNAGGTNGGGPGAGPVSLVGYRMTEHVVVDAKALMFSTKVTTDTVSTLASPPCAGAAQGAAQGTRVAWSTPMRGYRSDGTLVCEGNMCGKMGAPPRGRSEHHEGPRDVTLAPFVFSADLRTFTMAPVVVSKSDSPKQTTSLSLAGREVRRTCLTQRPCAR